MWTQSCPWGCRSLLCIAGNMPAGMEWGNKGIRWGEHAGGLFLWWLEIAQGAVFSETPLPSFFFLPFFFSFFFSPWWNCHRCAFISLRLRSERVSIWPTIIQMPCPHWSSPGSWLLPVRNSIAMCFGFETAGTPDVGAPKEGQHQRWLCLLCWIEEIVVLFWVFFCVVF